MKKLIPVENNSGLVKDLETGAVLNVNRKEIQSARERKKRQREKDLELVEVKSELQEIRKLITELMNNATDQS